jgi:hypothetical protein
LRVHGKRGARAAQATWNHNPEQTRSPKRREILIWEPSLDVSLRRALGEVACNRSSDRNNVV